MLKQIFIINISKNKSTNKKTPNINNYLGEDLTLKDLLKASFKSSILPRNQQPND